ncbi:oxidoreductase [Nesterenkonia sphaerica]|uniref:Oxidoreductase n=2 Tax=Nesterenkonia sphaerica TaxID=1804988 RepID=A0A5R9AJT1_9MICC|nr:oxidoreductase [Nesterenkonia sphaerica]
MAGLRTAEQIRSAGWHDEVVLIGDEAHPPYNRPPLSKEVLSSQQHPEEALSAVLLRQRASAASFTFRLGQSVAACNLAGQRVTLSTGERLSYDGLVVATGIRPRRLAVPGPTSGRYVVRTLEDALALRQQLRPGTKVLVIGCGFIGCEVAASALSLGCDVQLVEGSHGPMHRALGATVATAMRHWLTRRGLQIHAGRGVVEFLAHFPDRLNQVSGARLDDGTKLEAEIVVEAVGSLPNAEWLYGNSLDLSDGVLVDEHLRVRGAQHAVAVGDIARYPDPWTGGVPRRVEHWQGAIDTAKTAARSLVAGLTGGQVPPPYASIPSFWSDVFGTRVQGLGVPHFGTATEVLEGSLETPEAGVAIAYTREGYVVGLVTIALPPARLMELRPHLGHPLSDLLSPLQLTTT